MLMGSKNTKRVIGMLVVVMVVVMMGIHSEATMSCGQIMMELTPCVGYVTLGGNVPSGCCEGLRQVKAASKTDAQLQAACSCVMEMAAAIPGVKYDLINTIPPTCGVYCPMKFSPSLDCSKVHW